MNSHIPERGLNALSKILASYGIAKKSELLQQHAGFRDQCVYCEHPHEVVENPTFSKDGMYEFTCPKCNRLNRIRVNFKN